MTWEKLVMASAFLLLMVTGCTGINSLNKCNSLCIDAGFKEGNCAWPDEVTESYSESLGECLIPSSKHCGAKGACDCYCLKTE